jgi:hypothetical protein
MGFCCRESRLPINIRISLCNILKKNFPDKSFVKSIVVYSCYSAKFYDKRGTEVWRVIEKKYYPLSHQNPAKKNKIRLKTNSHKFMILSKENCFDTSFWYQFNYPHHIICWKIMIFEKKSNGSQLYLLHQNAAQWRKFSKKFMLWNSSKNIRSFIEKLNYE